MKCIAAVVVIAFVGFANAGILPAYPYAAYAAAPLADGTYTSIPAPHLYAAAPAPLAFRSYEAPHFYAAAPAPLAYAYAAPAPLTVAAIPGEARYTAINRGALHDAPLPGHALSQTSLNLQPAPGTL